MDKTKSTNQPSSEGKDEQLALLARQGDESALNALLTQYKPLVRSRARGYYLVGADHEDLVQEGMIGLYKAVRDYEPTKAVTFRAFADLCIRRQMFSAIKMAMRQKHRPLNQYVSLDQPVFDDDDRALVELLSTRGATPEESYIHRESFEGIRQMIATTLTDLERQVLKLFLAGKSYQDIACQLGRSTKGVDNALQRIKKKMAGYLSDRRA